MPPFDISDLFTMRRQPDRHSNSELVTFRNPDEIRTFGQRHRQRVDGKVERRHSSGRDLRIDLESGQKDESAGIRRSATLSHRSRGKRDSRIDTDNGSETQKKEHTTATATIAGAANEDRDHVAAEEKKFSWGSFRMSRLRRKHTSTDTQKHEYGEHRLEERVRWSTQLPSLEIVPPPSSVGTSSSADRYHLSMIDDAPPSATMNALNQLEGRELRLPSDRRFAVHSGSKSRILQPAHEYDQPLPDSEYPYTRSYTGADSKTISERTLVKPNLGENMLGTIIGTPTSPGAQSTSQHDAIQHRDQAISRSRFDSKQRVLSRSSLSVGLDDENTSHLSRSHSAQESSVYPLRRIPQRLHTTGSVDLQNSRTGTTHGTMQSRPGHGRYTDHDDDASVRTSSSAKQRHGHREAIIINRRIEGKTQSHHVASASTLGRSLTSTELFVDAELPRLSLTERPQSFARSTVHSIASGDSRPEYRFSLERSTLNSEIQAPSTSLMSLPTTPSGSGVPGPKLYQYLPLSDMEFRLVRVLPETMSTLKCEISHRSLHDSLDYIAISYAWGDGLDMKQLVVEGTKVLVPTSLYDVLKAVRQKKQEVLVWVDALCIDQQNKDERAMQVRLMGHIYSCAESVAIWLGPESDESAKAMQLLHQVAVHNVSPQRIRSVLTYSDSAALLALFKREYWRRLWVVQEVLLAKKKMVYCGQSVFPWAVYQSAADAFWGKDSDPHIRQGPSSFPDRSELMQLGDQSLLEIMRACRKKLSENPRDKVFGILGLVPDVTEHKFPVDYSQSVKTVYTDVVDYLISTTDRVDVIRESIHFPLHFNTAGLPTWCPDWSHIPGVSGLGRTLGFDASGSTKAQYQFHDERRKLEIVGIKLDIIKATGVAVGTFCASQDYLTAFLHWRAMLLHELNIEPGNNTHPRHEAFCRTLCLGQIPADQRPPAKWHELCYHVFSSLIREKMPRLPIDEDLGRCADVTGLIKLDARRKFLQDQFGDRMMGRSFCITDHGLIGMGSGYMTVGDLVVVPFGCSTPILLRPEGRRDEFRYVGDVYIDGYMHGEAVAQMEARISNRVASKYMLC